MRLPKPDSVIFDCDGVILNSNKIKTEAFRKAIEHRPPELVERFIDYHKHHGGISRYEKFKHYFSIIDPVLDPDRDGSEALDRYGIIVRDALLSCDLIFGFEQFAVTLKKRNIKTYVVSGGDQDELRYVFKKRSLSQYFDSILGSPRTKREIMQDLYRKKQVGRNSLFFGDSAIDFEVAREFDCYFIFVKQVSEWKDGEKINRASKNPIINHFGDVELIKMVTTWKSVKL